MATPGFVPVRPGCAAGSRPGRRIYQDKAGEYRFRLKAGNGEIVAVGESYPTADGAERGVEAVKRAAAEATVVRV